MNNFLKRALAILLKICLVLLVCLFEVLGVSPRVPYTLGKFSKSIILGFQSECPPSAETLGWGACGSGGGCPQGKV